MAMIKVFNNAQRKGGKKGGPRDGGERREREGGGFGCN
jgi:hypothetical protein